MTYANTEQYQCLVLAHRPVQDNLPEDKCSAPVVVSAECELSRPCIVVLGGQLLQWNHQQPILAHVAISDRSASVTNTLCSTGHTNEFIQNRTPILLI